MMIYQAGSLETENKQAVAEQGETQIHSQPNTHGNEKTLSLLQMKVTGCDNATKALLEM